MIARVFTPQDSCLYAVASRVGGGFGFGGDAGARGVRWGEWGAVAAREPAPKELCCLPPLWRVRRKVGGLPLPTGADGTLPKVQVGVVLTDHLGKGGLDPVEDIPLCAGMSFLKARPLAKS